MKKNIDRCMKVEKNIQKFFFDQAYKKWVKASTIYLRFNKDFLLSELKYCYVLGTIL